MQCKKLDLLPHGIKLYKKPCSAVVRAGDLRSALQLSINFQSSFVYPLPIGRKPLCLHDLTVMHISVSTRDTCHPNTRKIFLEFATPPTDRTLLSYLDALLPRTNHISSNCIALRLHITTCCTTGLAPLSVLCFCPPRKPKSPQSSPT